MVAVDVMNWLLTLSEKDLAEAPWMNFALREYGVREGQGPKEAGGPRRGSWNI
jgi:hypothetical protein